MEDVFINNDFATQIWNKQAYEINAIQRFFSQETVFQALKLYQSHSKQFTKHNQSADFITAVGNKLTAQPRRDFLVQPNDTSLDDYITRLENTNGQSDWCIAYFGLHSASWKIWDQVKIFSRLLLKNLTQNMPQGRFDVDCFLGNYHYTHTGIHADYAHNFAFSLKGGKTMYTWDQSFANLYQLKYPEYNPYKTASVKLHNEPDRVCYFPYDHYHIAESSNATSLVVNVAIWHDSGDIDAIANQLGINIQSSNNKYAIETRFANALLHDDQAMKLYDDFFRHYHPNKKQCMKLIMLYTLIKSTSFHLLVPRPVKKNIIIPQTITRDFGSIIQWYANENEILFSSNGHCATVTFSKNTMDFFAKIIDADQSIELNSFCTYQQEILLKLYEWGAFV